MENQVLDKVETIILDDSLTAKEALSGIDFTSNDKQIVFDLRSENTEKVLEDVKEIHSKEIELFSNAETSKNQLNIVLKELNGEIKLEAMKFLFTQEDLLDSYAILNLYNFIKCYNTFAEEFFESACIYVKDVEEFLDTKYELKDVFDKVTRDLCIYYLSVLKSCDKINTDFDTMIVLPLLYQRLLFITDFPTLAVLLNKVQDIDLSKTFVVNNANAFLDSLSLNQVVKKEIVSIIEG